MIDELLRNLTGPDWVTPFTIGAMAIPFVVGFLGILANAAHRKFRGAKIKSIWDYFTRDRGWTIVMVTGYVIAFAIVAKVLYMNVVVSLLVGFSADNILNRYTGGHDA